MKKASSIFYVFLFVLGLLVFSSQVISAKEIVVKKIAPDIFGNAIGTISIYNNGEVSIDYKYGLKKVEIAYCSKELCENYDYNYIKVLESDESNPNKNENPDEMRNYTYKIEVFDEGEYRVKVDAIFGIDSSYNGNNYMSIGPKETADTGDNYIKLSKANGVDDKNLKSMMKTIVKIVNTIVIPVLYGLITIVLVIKGALIGTAIVKSADNPQVRQEKIASLKWLVIGVVVAYGANSIIGVFTGFFGKIF